MGRFRHFTNGIFNENPTFRLVLGCCPTLAITTAAMNGIAMGLATTFVLLGSNMVISALRKIIPDNVRIPAFVVIIASFVTIVDMVMHAYMPAMYKTLGIYIPLIVVNCIIMGRAEGFAYTNNVLDSAGITWLMGTLLTTPSPTAEHNSQGLTRTIAGRRGKKRGEQYGLTPASMQRVTIEPSTCNNVEPWTPSKGPNPRASLASCPRGVWA